MKKLALLSALLVISASAIAAPVTPMDNYTTTEHGQDELARFWNTVSGMAKNMKGKDCFKRAHMWSFKLEREYGVKSKKIFMHYTDKFNHELDDQGKRGLGRFVRSVFSSNAGWDFHVAPAVNINGTDMVLDGKLRNGPDTIEAWVDFLTERGEYLLKNRQKDLVKDLKKYRKRLRRKNIEAEERENVREKIREIENKMQYLGLTENLNQKIDIKCKKIENIAQFDLEQKSEWCHYQEASMYYFGPLQLRLLNYGQINWDLRLPVTDSSYHNEQNFNEGADYVYRRWDFDQLEESLDELKPGEQVESIYEL